MDHTTAARLIELNRQFYADHAAAFARARGRGQTGLLPTLPHLPETPHVLDLGCGNGRLARFLASYRTPLSYIGIDTSPSLLTIARRALAGLPGVTAQLVQVDLATQWIEVVPGAPFDAVYVLAVLHHLPGFERRAQLLRQAAQVVTPNGVLVVSYWQFYDDPQQRAKIVPWAAFGIEPSQVEPGDALLAWAREAPGLRYCHHVDAAEAAALAAAAGLHVAAAYYADGRSGRLNLFQVCRVRSG